MAGAMLASFASNVKLKLQVDTAISTSDDPTPIYVLDELVSALSAGDTRAAVDAVAARLAHRSPVVKQKALKLVTHIGRKGSPDLRRLMARHSGAVRDLLHYRCDPDPFKGDTVWKRVQEYAQEALEAIHGTGAEGTGAAATGGSGGMLGGRIQGFGSEASGGHSGGGMIAFGSDSSSYGGGGRGGARMVGFGSADVAAMGGSISRLLQDGYSSAQFTGNGTASRLGAPASISQPIVQAGAAAGAAPAPPSAAAAGSGQHAAEQRLVDRICAPAGLRAAPGSEDLRAFVEGLAPLDGAAAARLLEKKLEGGLWQATLRALCAIEAVVESGSSTACGQLAVHFQAAPEAVRRAARSPQASVRQRAEKVLTLLGAGGAGGAGQPTCSTPGASSQQQQQQAPQQLFVEDLLGEAEPAAAGIARSASAAGMLDLLGEPEATAAPAAPQASAVDLLAGLETAPGGGAAATTGLHSAQQQPAAAVTPASSTADDLFGGMLVGSGSSQAAVAVPTQQPLAAAVPSAPTAAHPSGIDLLAGLSLGPSPSAAPPAPSAQLPPQQHQLHGGGAGALGDLLGGLSLGAAPAAASSIAVNGVGMLGGGLAMASNSLVGAPGAVPGMGMLGIGPAPGTGSMVGAAPLSSSAFSAPGTGMAGSVQQYQVQQQQQHQQFGGMGGVHVSAHGAPQHARQASLNNAHSGGTMLGGLGILDSTKDNSFNFVDDAIAAARRKP